MRSPFPGMDPFLEQYWSGVHTSLAVYARDQLQSQVRPNFIARIEERYFQIPRWLDPLTQRWIKIFERERPNRLITTVEFIGPINKTDDANRRAFLRRRSELLAAGTSLVEIDLTREGCPILPFPTTAIPEQDQGVYRDRVVIGQHRTQ